MSNTKTTFVAHLTANRCSWLPTLALNYHDVLSSEQHRLSRHEVASGLQVVAVLTAAEPFLDGPLVAGEVNVTRRCREVECDTCHS